MLVPALGDWEVSFPEPLLSLMGKWGALHPHIALHHLPRQQQDVAWGSGQQSNKATIKQLGTGGDKGRGNTHSAKEGGGGREEMCKKLLSALLHI